MCKSISFGRNQNYLHYPQNLLNLEQFENGAMAEKVQKERE